MSESICATFETGSHTTPGNTVLHALRAVFLTRHAERSSLRSHTELGNENQNSGDKRERGAGGSGGERPYVPVCLK